MLAKTNPVDLAVNFGKLVPIKSSKRVEARFVRTRSAQLFCRYDLSNVLLTYQGILAGLRQ
jgi:hypothetical protein